jgi:hypothetical protein
VDPSAWILALALGAVPPERAHNPPGWEEDTDTRRARYASIAADLAAVVYDPHERPLFDGPRGRAQTAALLLGIAVLESGLARDVDLGPCWRGEGGRGPRCDRGRAFCVLQVHADGPGHRTREGWTGEDLTADRRKCFRAGLAIARGSFGRAAGADPSHRLDSYAGGDSIAAHEAGSKRLDYGAALFLRGLRKGVPLDAEVTR